MSGTAADRESLASPLMPRRGWRSQQKSVTRFGYLPVWSECVPLDESTCKPDWAGIAENIVAGIFIGVREVLGGIVSASLVFSSVGITDQSDLFPFGIRMMWYSTTAGIIWYAMFGHLQYGYPIAQDIIGILQSQMALFAAKDLADTPEKLPATVFSIITVSAVVTGATSALVGKLGLGKFMLLFPTPVTNGFFGAIGIIIFRSSLQTASGVHFEYFYPISMADFLTNNSLAQIALQLATVCCIRQGPKSLRRARLVAPHAAGDKFGLLAFQLLPLVLFYLVVFAAGIGMKTLEDAGWTYPFVHRRNLGRDSEGPLGPWATYQHLCDADMHVLFTMIPGMGALVMMAVLCTVIGVLSITDSFPLDPDGYPAPPVDFDKELTTVGVGSMLLGLTGGTATFHTFNSKKLRINGGTHRIGLLAVACCVGLVLLCDAPVGHYVPKWYIAGLFMNTAIHFLKGALFDENQSKTMFWRGYFVPSPQYCITLFCVLAAIFLSPGKSIGAGLVLSIALFLVNSSAASPVINVVIGNRVVSRSKRPVWEMRTLRREGDRIILLYLQGQFFFGSARKLVAALNAATSVGRVKYCILSFARVPSVDPSAVRHLKSATDRIREKGCEVIFCRTNHDVFVSLASEWVITTPDPDLVKHLQGLRWKTNQRLTSKDSCRIPSVLTSRQDSEFPSDVQLNPDGFAHETDALDYCDEQVVTEFCYGGNPTTPDDFLLKSSPTDNLQDGHSELEPYMLAYRNAVTTPFTRLEEWAFEDMNGLPRGLMKRLSAFCRIRVGLPVWTKLHDVIHDVDRCLCFILRGSVSVVQMLKQADGAEISLMEPQLQGFSFRQGKRLLKRYPPGHVAGIHSFFLMLRGQSVDPDLDGKLVISSKLGPTAEIWVMSTEDWETLPQDLKGPLTEMLCVQLADSAQHTRLQER